jgi:hypothetical protein
LGSTEVREREQVRRPGPVRCLGPPGSGFVLCSH